MQVPKLVGKRLHDIFVDSHDDAVNPELLDLQSTCEGIPGSTWKYNLFMVASTTVLGIPRHDIINIGHQSGVYTTNSAAPGNITWYFDIVMFFVSCFNL